MMKFEEKLKKLKHEDIWQEYCGFLDLNIDSYMNIQKRLMLEQISLWSECELGKKILRGKHPQTIEEFRQMVPLTTYEDYADILLQKKGEMLPDYPVIWIQTTWECGKHPIKVAPYTKEMLDTYKNNVITCLILSTSTEKGKFNIHATDNILYGLAPLPYATGLFPLLLNEEIGIEFLPPVKEAVKMSFSERNKMGFKLGLKKGIDFFFGVGSVTYYVSLCLSGMGSGTSKHSDNNTKKGSLFSYSPKMLIKLIMAKYRCKEERRELKPKDLFKLKGFMCAGTDSECYKDDLEDLWGIRPMEIFAGTEPSCIGTETWTRDGMYFFPDVCFYEFIPESEMNKNLEDPAYQPKTYLMNEVIPGEKYELVISVLKGGAFVRYRVGDVYRCVGLENTDDKTRIPRFKYVDRIPTVIDIAGFTRISEEYVQNVVELSGLPIENWIVVKEYNEQKRPLMHMYVEMKRDSLINSAISKEILKDHLTIYFKYFDNDYKDLKRILGIDPLKITILRSGAFSEYEKQNGNGLRHINPSAYEVRELLRFEEKDNRMIGGQVYNG